MNLGGLDVGMVGLGTAPLAFKDITPAQAVATIHAAVDAGVRVIDSALAYTRPGHESFAESAIAAALGTRSDRDEVVVATKGGHRRQGSGFPIDASPAALRADCEVSLRALGVEQIDLYQLHHVDPNVPLEDSVEAMRQLQRAGKIAMIGLSNVNITQIERARAVGPIVSVQNRLSLGHRDDLPTVQYCRMNGIAYLAYMPLGATHAVVARRMQTVAARHGVSTQQVQLAWLLAQGSHVLPLVGASRPATIRDSAAAAQLYLDAEDVRRLG